MTDYNRSEQAQKVFKEKRKPKGPIKFKISLNEEQKEAKEQILAKPYSLIQGFAGGGKAQPLDCKIYTPDGYKLMGDIKIGDKIFGLNNVTEVIGIFPQGKEKVYEVIFNEGSRTRCSENHLWTVMQKKYSLKSNKWEVKTTKELINDLQLGIEYRIPNSSCIEFNEQELPLNPYLLGFLLAEGHLGNTSTVFSTQSDFLKEKIHNIIKHYDCNTTKLNDYDYRIKKVIYGNKKNKIQEELIKLNLAGTNSYNKFIPSNYKYNSKKNQILLLQGLFDGDGYVTKEGLLYYNTSSKTLCDDVIEIIKSLGGRVNLNKYYPKYSYKNEKKISSNLHYEIVITINDYEQLVTLPYKKERLSNRKFKIKYLNKIIKEINFLNEQETQCIKVSSSDSLYVTDDFIVTHNTLLGVNIALDLFFKGEIEKIIITRPTVSKEDIGFLPGDLKDKMDPWLAPIYDNLYLLYEKTKIEKMLTDGQIEIVPFAFLRGRTFCNAVVIVDECQNITHSQTELMMGRLGIGSYMIFCGDIRQTDLKSKKDSGISFFKKLAVECPDDVNLITLKKNHRHPSVEKILKVFEDYSD